MDSGGAEGKTLQSPRVLERTHRSGPVRDAELPLTLIMKFLNHKDQQAVTAATRAAVDIRYKDQQVRFYSDLATGTHQLRKQFDPVRQPRDQTRGKPCWQNVDNP
ncbi:LINE-1 type transposase domain containing protein 1 [Dissostichus eleginoides]|uniref:LINE-1 type transposase domain containing protein 1 n=1 Tax=Dissostichus eleginoides TaxID=100907 RepID=A0AAD9BRM5_DISEL|nr:LINE-1 type transposase domain containing protein 1 [Dissostichus eleginoides]